MPCQKMKQTFLSVALNIVLGLMSTVNNSSDGVASSWAKSPHAQPSTLLCADDVWGMQSMQMNKLVQVNKLVQMNE